MSIYAVMFYGLAAVIVAATALAITRRNLMHAIVYLVLSFIGTAMLFYLLGAPFLAVLEVVIYAGAIMVLFLFIVMMLEIKPDERTLGPWLRQWAPALALSGICLMVMVGALYLGRGNGTTGG
jgi:NADH-quinone oxidoreductase subunit J